MRSWTIAFSAGVIVAGLLPRLPALPVGLLMLGAGLLLHCRQSLRLPAAFITGVAWLCCYGQLSLERRWPEPPFARDVWGEGTIWTVPVATARGQRFQFRLDRLCLQQRLDRCDFAQLPNDGRKVLLTLYQPQVVEPGQRWRWQLRLRPPHGFANPGGFDYEAWLMQQRIDATGYVRDNRANTLLDPPAGRRLFEQARLHFIDFIERANNGSLRYPHLLRALTVGDGSTISDAEWQLFADTGTTHLLVISGSHVALICLWLFATAYWLSSRSTRLLLRLPASHSAAVLAMLGAWSYTGLAGFSLPALRALLMAMLMLLAILLRRHCSAVNNLCLALAGMLAFDPLAAQNPGFWLSFVAVAVLLQSVVVTMPSGSHVPVSRLRKAAHLGWHFVLLQWKLSVVLLPILLLYFQQTSLLAPLVNLLTIPLIGWLVVPLALAGVLIGVLWPWAGGLLLVVSDQLLHVTMIILRYSTSVWPANVLILPALSLAGLAVLLATTIATVWAPARWQRLLALVLLPLGFLLRPPALPAGSVRVTVLDVGQGLAVMVSTPQHHLLYDAGPQYSSRFDAGSDVVLPALRRNNIRHLDSVIISHADNDHAGGLAGIIEAFPTAHYLGSDTTLFPAPLSHARCSAGESWQWEGVSFRLLHPDDRAYDDNNGSCVLLIENAGRRLLLTGDIERPVESRLLQRYAELRADVVVAPHHGSRSSSSLPFVRQLAPDVVVFSSGYQNRFKHPAPEVVARYLSLGATSFLTASSGAVRVDMNAAGELTVTEHRQLRRRFWSIGQPQ